MLSIIAAVARNGVIGCKGGIPWDIPADRRRFRELTMGHPVLMGRKTCESIGAPLPGRRCIVLSRQPGFRAEGYDVVADAAEALRLVDPTDELFIAGGADLYRQFLPLADRLYVSHIGLIPDGDAWFPEIPATEFTEDSREILSTEPLCTLVVYRRTVFACT